ncbi:MAG: F0F1 ATP synthase subunit B [Acholeplasmatales bacterium]|nr:F0F1 ATP synthase subunit B [Acholeplasmatales bacterium]
MFLIGNIAEALEKIRATIQETLGPLFNTKNLTVDRLTQYGIDFGIQIGATILLFIIVAIFFWKPITKILEKRREVIDKELTDAEQAKQNAIEIEAELNKQLSAAKEQVKEMLDRAEKEANVRRDEIINQAREDARRRMENLQIELEQERNSMEKEIRQEIVSVAFAAAEKIVSKEINQDKYMDVVDQILKGANE